MNVPVGNKRPLSVKLGSMDAKKLDVLKKRYGYSSNTETLRYILTKEVETVVRDEKYTLMMLQRQNEQDQNQASGNTSSSKKKRKETDVGRNLYC